MKKAVTIVLEEQDLMELIRILLDEDEAGAIAFLRTHFKGKAREQLEGG